MKYNKYAIILLLLFSFGCGVFYRSNNNCLTIEMEIVDLKAHIREEFKVKNDLSLSYTHTNTHSKTKNKKIYKLTQGEFNGILAIIDLNNPSNNYIVEKRGFLNFSILSSTRIIIIHNGKIICDRIIEESDKTLIDLKNKLFEILRDYSVNS